MNTTVAAHAPWSKRPRFAPRQLLDAARLNAALDDELERQRLLNLSLHGWGVVFGFGVRLEDGAEGRRERHRCVLVSCGLALDPFGRMLHTEDRHLSLDDLEGDGPTSEGRYTLYAHHAERLDPADHACSGSGPQWREYGLAFTVRRGCKPVEDRCPDLEDPCLSRTDYVRRRIGADEGSPGRSRDLDCVCDRPGSLRSTHCGSWCYDPGAGVPIACLEVRDLHREKEGGDTPCFVISGVCTQQCSPVRHVYRSPLLRELIDCCDVALPRVEEVSWASWDELGTVPREDFVGRMGSVDEADAEDGLTIRFDRPVLARTLTPASVLMTVLTQRRSDDYWKSGRVPMMLRPLGVTGELARGVQLVPDIEWLDNEIFDKRTTLDDGLRLEITIRGQLVRDECGHLLDAVPPDVGCRPCRARPGDDLLWAFEVAARGAPGRSENGREQDESTGEKT